MTIFDKIQTKQTGQRRPLMTAVCADMAHKATGKSQPMGFGTNDEYVMMLSVECTFWAGSADKEAAFRQAELTLIHGLYADILPNLHLARSAILGDDQEAAFKALGDIERAITGER